MWVSVSLFNNISTNALNGLWAACVFHFSALVSLETVIIVISTNKTRKWTKISWFQYEYIINYNEAFERCENGVRKQGIHIFFVWSSALKSILNGLDWNVRQFMCVCVSFFVWTKQRPSPFLIRTHDEYTFFTIVAQKPWAERKKSTSLPVSSIKRWSLPL